MSTRTQTIFAKAKLLAFGLLLLLSVVAPLLVQSLQGVAEAAGGEKYAWATTQNVWSITATGGTFGSSGVQFQVTPPSGPQQTYELTLASSYTFSANGITCTAQPNSLTITAFLSNPSTGTMNASTASGGTIAGYCSTYTADVQAIAKYFNGNITISGTAPWNQGGSGSGGLVTVTLVPSESLASVSATATITVTGPSSTSTTVSKISGATDGSGTTYYNQGHLTLAPPGVYKICANWGSGNGCTNYTQNGTDPGAAEIDDPLAPINSAVDIHLCFNGVGSTTYTVGPYQLAIEDQSGNQIVTANSTSQTISPVQGASATAQEVACIPGSYDGNPSDGSGKNDTGLTGTLSSTDPNVAQEINANKQNFKVCIVAINKCMPYDANVLFDLTNNDANPLVAQSTTTANKPTCEQTDDNNSWLLCPIFNGLAGFTDWIFNNILQPFLYTAPISTNANDPSFKIWSTFRVYGDVFLVIAILIIVFGESIGGGIIDAYTAKKALPRVLIAAILINLSVYIVALLVDATNVLGQTIGHVVTGPIPLQFAPSAAEGNAAIGGGIIGLFLASGGIAAVLAALFTHAAALRDALWLAFFALMPIVLAIATLFFVLIMRKGIILTLVLISPIAFALYCLPATEKWFRRWWEMLFRILLLYPAVTLLYAVADVLSVTVMEANGATLTQIQGAAAGSSMHGTLLPHVASILSAHGGFFADTTSTITSTSTIILVIVVVFFIEGGVKFVGIIWVVKNGEQTTAFFHGMVQKGADAVNKKAEGRRAFYKKRWEGDKIQGREKMYRGLQNLGDSDNGFKRFVAKRGMSRLTGGGVRDILAESAAHNAEQAKIAQATTDHGDDTVHRANTVNKQWALDNDATGGRLWRRSKSGGREFRTAGGAWVSEMAVDEAKRLYGGNNNMLRADLAYEMNKANTQEEQEHMAEAIPGLMYKNSALNEGQLNGVLKGAGFERQNVNRTWKHTKVKDGKLVFDRNGAMKEMDGKKSAYELGQNSADYWRNMTTGLVEAKNSHDTLTIKKQQLQAQGRDLTVEEQGQLDSDKDYIRRAMRVVGTMERGGAMYGAGDDAAAQITAMQGLIQTPPPQVQTTAQPGQTVQPSQTTVNIQGGQQTQGNIPLQQQPQAQPGAPAIPAPRQSVENSRREMMVGQGAVPETAEAMVQFARTLHNQFPEFKYDGPVMSDTASNAPPSNVPAPNYEDLTGDNLENRIGVGPRRGPQI